MNTYIIQPFEQRVIWRDPLDRNRETSAIELLNEDLSFCRTEFTFRGSPEETLAEAVEKNIVKPIGWTKIETEGLYTFEDIWPQAVRQLGEGNRYIPYVLQ